MIASGLNLDSSLPFMFLNCRNFLRTKTYTLRLCVVSKFNINSLQLKLLVDNSYTLTNHKSNLWCDLWDITNISTSVFHVFAETSATFSCLRKQHAQYLFSYLLINWCCSYRPARSPVQITSCLAVQLTMVQAIVREFEYPHHLGERV